MVNTLRHIGLSIGWRINFAYSEHISLGKGSVQAKSVQNCFGMLGEENEVLLIINMDGCCTGVRSSNFGSPRAFVGDACQIC